MKTYEEMEYTNVSMQFEHSQIQSLIEQVVEAGLPVAWKESKKYFTLSIQTVYTTQRITFDKYGKWYKLRNKSYQLKDSRFAEIFQKFIHEVKGHAILKFLSNDQLIIQNIRYGEPVRIVEIKGPKKKILFEKECMISMDQVTEAMNRQDAEERIPELKKEMDDYLLKLFHAMEINDQISIHQYKEELEKLRIEMLMLEI